MSVILIGMPSSGKSTVGVILAKRLGYSFIDSDLLIQKREGRLLCELIEELGVERFLQIEGEANRSITDKQAVIATGGSAIYDGMAMEHLKELGSIVYLEISYNEMLERLGDYSHRGIAMREGVSLEDMYNERKGLYERYADITINAEKFSISSAIEEIIERLGEKK